jgi:hypothetical protein
VGYQRNNKMPYIINGDPKKDKVVSSAVESKVKDGINLHKASAMDGLKDSKTKKKGRK